MVMDSATLNRLATIANRTTAIVSTPAKLAAARAGTSGTL